jgi:hypothetical protein
MPAVEVEESEESEADEAEGEESEESEGGDGGEDGDGGDVDDEDGAEDGDGGEGGGVEKGGGEGGGGEGDGGGRVGWRKSRRKRGLPPAIAVVPPFQRTAKGPTMPYSGGDGVCPICTEGEDKLLRLPCSHIYCAECLGKWKNRCPTQSAKPAFVPPNHAYLPNGSRRLFDVISHRIETE